MRGYILYGSAPEISINIATSLCTQLQAVAVHEKDVARVAALGLQLLVDARHLTYDALLTDPVNSFNPNVLAVLSPKQPDLCNLAVAEGALVIINAAQGGYTQGLQHIAPVGSVFGWGENVEFGFTDARCQPSRCKRGSGRLGQQFACPGLGGDGSGIHATNT